MKNNDLQNIDPLVSKLIVIRDIPVLLDRDVAEIYGVQTREINQAVRNNPEKFPDGYILQLDKQEVADLKSKYLISSQTHGGTRHIPKLFTEKGLYMLATIIKSKQATAATLEIIETFAQVRELKSNLLTLSREGNSIQHKRLMTRFSELLSAIVMPELRPDETETSLELNFFIGKLKHTVKRKRRDDGTDIVEEPETPYIIIPYEESQHCKNNENDTNEK